jgi:SAM-dependent methyltransferase
MTTLSKSIADSERTAAAAPQTHGRLQSAWGRCFAAIYEPLMQATENGGNAARRAAVLARARGTVVELGAGTGLNLPHYPPDVELVLTEPEPPMARRLLERLRESGRQARVLQASADRIPLPDASVDTVVCTLVLCTVSDPRAALTEVDRVLRPGGQLLFLEHVRADDPRIARWQDRIHPIWRRFGHGCNCNRPTPALIEQSPLALESIERGELPKSPPIVRPLAVGRAVSPG